MASEGIVFELLDRWESSRKAGDELTVEELCSDHPRLIDEVRAKIEALQATAWLEETEASSEDVYASAHSTMTHIPGNEKRAIPLVGVQEFLASVVANGLLDERESLEWGTLQQQESLDAEALAQRLVNDSKLTEFQATALLEQREFPILIDRYRVLDRLGEGGMGVVYKALHVEMDRIVALKVLSGDVVDRPDKVERFQREIRAIASLSHPNIVAANDAARDKGVHFLVTEFVEGCDLAQWVRMHGPLPWEESVSYIIQAAKGLAYAHRRGVVHRDVKPGNLLRTSAPRAGIIKVADLGLAQMRTAPLDLRDGTQTELTEEGVVMGTVHYMSPEQARDTKNVDHRSDIYSLGCTLYFLVSGSPPFRRESAFDILLAHRENSPPSLGEAQADVPEELEAVYQKMVAKEPGERFQSMEEVVSGLEELPESPAPRPSETRSVGSWKAVATWAGLAVGLVVLICSIVFFLKTDDGTIRIEILDPKLEVRFADGVYRFQHSGKEVTLTPGKKTLRIKRDDFEFETKNFVLLEGENPVLRIRFLDGKIVVTQNGQKVEGHTKGHSPEEFRPKFLTRPTWKRGSEDSALPGMIPAPSKLPNVGRWQIVERSPCSTKVRTQWSPDGRWIACVERSHSDTWHLRIYDGESFRLAKILWAGSGTDLYPRWSPDSRRIALLDDHWVRVFDIEGREEHFEKPEQRFLQIRWSPDSKRLVVNGLKRLVFLEVGKPYKVTKGRSSEADYLEWSVDGQWLAIGWNVTQVGIWSAKGESKVSLNNVHGAWAVDWHPQENLLAVADREGAIRFVKPDGKEESPIELENKKEIVRALRWSPDGSKLAVHSDSGLSVWSKHGKLEGENKGWYLGTQTQGEKGRLGDPWLPNNRDLIGLLRKKNPVEGKGRAFGAVLVPPDSKQTELCRVQASWTWSPDERHLVFWNSWNRESTVELWEVTAKVARRIALPALVTKDRHVSTVSWNAKGDRFLVAFDTPPDRAAHGGLFVFDTSGKRLANLIDSSPIRAMAISPNGEWLAEGNSRGVVLIRSAEGLPMKRIDTPGRRPVTDLDWHPDSRHLAVCNSGEVNIFDSGSRRPIRSWRASEASPDGIFASFRPDRGDVLTVSAGKLALWGWKGDPAPTKWIDGASGGSVSWNRTGTHFALSPGSSKTPSVWTAKLESKPLGTLPEKRDEFLAFYPLAWNPVGNTLMVPRRSRLDLFSIDGKKLRAFGEGDSVAWSPDGNAIASATESIVRGVRLWTPDGHTGPSLEGETLCWSGRGRNHLAFSPDSSTLVCASGNRISFWSARSGKLERLLVRSASDRTYIFSAAGEVLYDHPSPLPEFYHLVQKNDGSLELLTASEFIERTRKKK